VWEELNLMWYAFLVFVKLLSFLEKAKVKEVKII